MSGFFDTTNPLGELRRGMLSLEAKLWIGTPFVAHSQLRGAGVDCIHLAAALYMASGAMKEFTPPNYSLDGGHHNAASEVLQWLAYNPSFVPVYCRCNHGSDQSMLQFGDVLCFRFGLSEHHVAVLLDHDAFIHSRFRRSVEYTSLSDPVYTRHLTSAFRPIGGVA